MHSAHTHTHTGVPSEYAVQVHRKKITRVRPETKLQKLFSMTPPCSRPAAGNHKNMETPARRGHHFNILRVAGSISLLWAMTRIYPDLTTVSFPKKNWEKKTKNSTDAKVCFHYHPSANPYSWCYYMTPSQFSIFLRRRLKSRERCNRSATDSSGALQWIWTGDNANVRTGGRPTNPKYNRWTGGDQFDQNVVNIARPTSKVWRCNRIE